MAAPVPGQFVDANGDVIARPVPKLIGPTGEIIANPAPQAVTPGGPAPKNLPPPPPAEHREPPSGVSEDGITLNFVDADVRDIAKAVLGDFLGLNYAVGANVTGTVTIQTSRPVSRADALVVFEQALQLNGLALVRRAGVFDIVPLADARHQSGTIATAHREAEPGFGVQVVPLKYAGAVEMQHLLEPLVPSQAVIYADAARNFLLIQGSEQERAAMVDEIALFDVDWLAKMSFELLAPKYTDVTALTRELNEILGGEHRALADVVRLVPIQRLNAILAISPQPRYLAQLRQWMERLDQPGQGYERRMFFYAVQNGRAADIADALNRSLYGGKYKSPTDKPGADDDIDDAIATPTVTGETGTPAPAPATPAATASAPGSDIPVSPEATAATATITVDKANNALLIYGTPQQYGVIQDVLHHMDVAPVQVQLEAVVAEVTLNDGLQYGVQYFYQPSGKHEIVLSNGNSTNITPALPGFSYLFTQGTNIKVILSALSQITHVEVVSSPNVMVLNNGTALLEVGDQVPITTAQAIGVQAGGAPLVNSIEYRSTGVILKVTPSVNKSGLVTLDVLQEVSNVAPEADQTTLGSPTFAQRKVRSTVAIHDNETVALGGLISNSRTKGSSGIPFLSAIPVVGGLFGTKTDNTDRTELMVLITPHIVESLEAARAVTEELRQKFPAVRPLLGKAP